VLPGLALAYLGRKADALREGREAVKMLPISRDANFGPYGYLRIDPTFDPVRSNPRFKNLAEGTA
jgi:hypothetical protein